MARILDKLVPSTAQRMVKLRQKQDWLKTELNELAGVYEAKKQRVLDGIIVKSNKKLVSLAKECYAQDYASAMMEDKLQKYDVKTYLSHRAVNHKAAKSIFESIKSGEDWSVVLKTLKAENDALLEKRNAYVKKLEATYNGMKAMLDEKYSSFEAVKRANLQRKIDVISAKIEENKAHTTDSKLPDDVLLSVKGLKMYFGGLRAVDDLTFDVKKGEIFGLIGPNGAGKTTVFNCITRFYDATGGDMYFENKYGEVVDLRNYKVHDIILQGISRTFQNIELVKEISVMENLLVAGTRAYRSGFVVHALGLPILKKEEKIMRQKAKRILKFMGLESYANWLAFGLPYGILKKVEIARALMADARLIIMDEPAAGLNDSETAELTETIRKIRDEFGVTILLVEHDMSLVMNVCDTVCAISFGQMLAIGTTDEIQKNKAVQEAYLGVEEDE